jgi:signal peptidase I
MTEEMLMNKPWQRLFLAIAVVAKVQVACGQQYSRIRQTGYSMEPNISDGDMFKVEEIPLTALQRGDLIIVKDNDKILLKRLIGLPNETVSIRDGTVFINGSALDEPYEVVPGTYTMDEVQLDNDSYFFLGDNRPDSIDSHQLGPVKGDAIIGKAIPE